MVRRLSRVILSLYDGDVTARRITSARLPRSGNGEAAAGRTLGIEFEAGAEQGLRNLRAEPPQCPPPRPIAVDDDPQIDVLRHAADQTVRAAERRAAAEHEPHMAERPAQRRRSPQAP
jgi:hypothetical protein